MTQCKVVRVEKRVSQTIRQEKFILGLLYSDSRLSPFPENC